MKNKSKKLAVIAMAISLTFSGLSSAQAADLPLTYSQFIESQGYKDLQSVLANYATKMESATGINIDMTVTTTSSLGQAGAPVTANIKATKTAAVSTLTMGSETINVGYYDGFYYLGLDDATYELDSVNYLTIGKRLPSSKIKKVKMSDALSSDATLLDIKPSTLFSSDTSKNLLESMLSTESSKFSFSEVTSSPNADVSSSTDYKNEMNYIDPKSGTNLNVLVTQTFNSDGYLTTTKMVENMSLLGLSITANVLLTQNVDNTIVLTAPEATTVITSAKLIALDKQMSAELSLKPTAAKIVTKAKALAKSAKKTLAGSHLVAAAKALKVSTKAVTNGIKLTGKYKGVSGYLCVTAVKGVATTKNC